MSESLISSGGELLAQKGVSAQLAYTLDYTADLAGAALTNSVWTEATGGVNLSGNAFSDTQVTIVISGGASGTWYVLQNVATDTSGQVHEAAVRLFVEDAALVGNGALLSPFPSWPAAIATLRRDRIYSILNTYAPGITFDDDYLLEKLVSATSYIQHRLRTPLTPVEMLPNTALQSEFDAFNNTVPPTPYMTEPAYDYDPEFFQGNEFGRMLTRQKPIISLHSMAFVYPTPQSVLYEIPTDWFRVDYKYGVINLLPINTSFQLPLNAFILSALGGGRIIPAFIQIRYSAGLTNIAQNYPEILNVIKQQAILSVYQDLFLPSSTSQSTSADGLSQSVSYGFDAAKYEDGIEKQISNIQTSLHGVKLWVV